MKRRIGDLKLRIEDLGRHIAELSDQLPMTCRCLADLEGVPSGLLEATLAADDRSICRLGARWCGRFIAILRQENEQGRAAAPSAMGMPRAKVSGTLLDALFFPDFVRHSASTLEMHSYAEFRESMAQVAEAFPDERIEIG